MAKAERFTVRLTTATEKAMEAEARRVKRSKSEIVESLVRRGVSGRDRRGDRREHPAG
jgi:hypothetical protein